MKRRGKVPLILGDNIVELILTNDGCLASGDIYEVVGAVDGNGDAVRVTENEIEFIYQEKI